MPSCLILPDGKEFHLTNGIYVIGRSSTADICINEAVVSRTHAKLIVDNDIVLLLDVNSKNGTFVNGKKIEKTILQDGDVICLARPGIQLIFKKQTESEDNIKNLCYCKSEKSHTSISDIVLEINGETINLYKNRDLFIGRSSENDIVISNPGVSRSHARLRVENSKVFLEDLNSTNGTWVEGRRWQKGFIKKTSEIYFGPVKARIIIPSSVIDTEKSDINKPIEDELKLKGIFKKEDKPLKEKKSNYLKNFFFLILVLSVITFILISISYFLKPKTKINISHENRTISYQDKVKLAIKNVNEVLKENPQFLSHLENLKELHKKLKNKTDALLNTLIPIENFLNKASSNPLGKIILSSPNTKTIIWGVNKITEELSDLNSYLNNTEVSFDNTIEAIKNFKKEPSVSTLKNLGISSKEAKECLYKEIKKIEQIEGYINSFTEKVSIISQSIHNFYFSNLLEKFIEKAEEISSVLKTLRSSLQEDYEKLDQIFKFSQI